MRGVWFGLCVGTVGAEAQATPWAREAGSGYGRLAAASEEVDGLEARRFDAYGEYGLTDNWTLTAKAEQVMFPGAEDFDASGFRVTARRQLWRHRNLVVAAEGGAVYGAAVGGVRGCDRAGAEARVSVGTSGGFGNRQWFAFADAATRQHANQCWRNRVELGAGREIVRNVFFVNQVWLERGSTEARSDKFESGLLWRGGDFDVSFAYRQETSGRFEEQGVVVALARRF